MILFLESTDAYSLNDSLFKSDGTIQVMCYSMRSELESMPNRMLEVSCRVTY